MQMWVNIYRNSTAKAPKIKNQELLDTLIPTIFSAINEQASVQVEQPEVSTNDLAEPPPVS
jgi:hypothetical protein